ncbi:MAG: 2-C-methyl-D-erythritol 2,4-cyclodiphosphate synthase [Planctomycetota bacterium]
MNYRVGIGFDIHRLESDASPNAGLMIGGVRVPCAYRVIAHSDGDVLLHALCDALLGAVAAGDLGEHFSDSDPTHRGRDSAWFVGRVLALPQLAGWRLANIDANIITEVPRLMTHKPSIRARVAELLRLPLDAIGIKARSHEGMDAVGEKRAISAQAVVLLEKT